MRVPVCARRTAVMVVEDKSRMDAPNGRQWGDILHPAEFAFACRRTKNCRPCNDLCPAEGKSSGLRCWQGCCPSCARSSAQRSVHALVVGCRQPRAGGGAATSFTRDSRVGWIGPLWPCHSSIRPRYNAPPSGARRLGEDVCASALRQHRAVDISAWSPTRDGVMTFWWN
jgi:hypothetical protein